MDTAVLIVDDEQAFLDSVLRMLRMEGFTDLTALSDPTAAAALLQQRQFDIALLDVTMPVLDGLELLKQIKELSPQTECLMVTAHESIPLVIRAVRLGAYDYLIKPLSPEQLVHSINRALERQHLVRSLILHSQTETDRALKRPQAFAAIDTADRRMLRLLREAELHAASDIPVLITGETGVGKELLARAVHDASPRAAGPFVAVNMLSLSPTLFESEFFGHVRGSFTGADRDKQGYLDRGRGGTLFLDEIGDLPLEIQGKLLRILQENEFTPVGRTRPERADVRFVAATNLDLEARVEQQRFRKDLYYRLQFARLHMPALRERRNDIPLLAARLLAAHQPAIKLSAEAEAELLAHDWPGNVRELKGALEAAANLAESGTIEPQHLRLPRRRRPNVERASAAADQGSIDTLEQVERRHILAVYERLGRNKALTARTLDIGLQTLHRKLKAYDVK